MKMQMWALLAIAVLGIYILPPVIARFAGTHTMEYNQSEGIYSMYCTRCHKYVSDELGATDLATDVVSAHRAAGENSLYIGTDSEINITQSELPLFGGAMINVCLVCHLVEQGSINLTHTKMTIRVCTDEDCHGDSTTRGSDYYNDAGGVGGNLSSSTDAHSSFFNPLETQPSNYAEEGGGNYSMGFYACMGCHTHVGLTLQVSRPIMIGLNMTVTESSSGMTETNLDNLFINESRNTSTGLKNPGSVW